jgi:hypothetical protein
MSRGETLSAFLAFLAERFSFSVRPGGFLLAVFRGDLSDMGHLVYISISHERRESAPASQDLGDQFVTRPLAQCSGYSVRYVHAAAHHLSAISW